jgi:hypothetical protein
MSGFVMFGGALILGKTAVPPVSHLLRAGAIVTGIFGQKRSGE